MYACICAAVTERQVHSSILAGARTAEEIGDRCGAGTGCGTCRDYLEERIEEVQPQPAAEVGLTRIA